MLHTTFYNIAVTVIMIVMGMLSSCNRDCMEIPDNYEETDGINFCLSISSTSGITTRSTLSEEYGTALENRIDPNDLKILLFDNKGGDDILKYILYQDGVSSDNTSIISIGQSEYHLKVKLDPEFYSNESRFLIVVLTNWRNLIEQEKGFSLIEGETSLNEILDATYRLNADADSSSDISTWIPEDDSLIPMFGLLNCLLSGYSTDLYNEANPMDMGTVNLLRAFAKIEIIDNSDKSVATINKISIKRHNTRGHLTPLIDKGEDTDQVSVSRIPSATGVVNPAGYSETPVKFHKSGNKYVAYVPEFELGEDQSLRNRDCIDVEITYKGISEVRKIFFAPYNKVGNPYVPEAEWGDEWKALLRNHIYRFTINSINVDPNIYLTVDVQPYSSAYLSPELGLERTDDGYIVVRDKNGNVIKYIRTDGSILTLETVFDWPELGIFTGVFDSWKRILVGYFPDGRLLLFNYEDDHQDESKLLSWEIYASSSSKYGSYLMETFSFKDSFSDGEKDSNGNDEIILPAFTHSYFDPQGHLIEQNSYKSRLHYQEYVKNPDSVEPPFKRVEFEGDRYGDKVITYYDGNGKIYCRIEITGETETYIYWN